MPYTLQQELEALEKLEDWLNQSNDKQSSASVIIHNVLSELKPSEAVELLCEYITNYMMDLVED